MASQPDRIEAELPAPLEDHSDSDVAPTAAVIELDPESAARVETLKAEVITLLKRAKKDAEDIAECWVEAGKRLIAIKHEVGHGKFGQWIEDNCDFSQSTAENYMNLAKAVEAGTHKIPMIAKMGLVASLKTTSNQADPVVRQHKKLQRAFGVFRSKD